MPDDSAFLSGQFDPPAILLFVAVEITLAVGFLRLIDGSGEVTFLGRTFKGLDPEFGTLASLEPITDGFGSSAPGLRIGINAPTTDAAAILGGEDMQGRPVLIWVGTVLPATGAVVTDPVLVFDGLVDQGVLSIGQGTRTLALDCVSIWEYLFDDAQGVRLTNAYHQAAWPGELGMEFVTAISRQLPWGSDSPRPQVVADALTVRL
jgi:hypothetical protein